MKTLHTIHFNWFRFIHTFKYAGLILLFLCFHNAKANWDQTNGPYGGTVNCFALNGTTVFAGTTNGVFYTSDNGNNWTPASTGISGDTITAIAVMGTTLYAGSHNGVFISSDNGSSWSSFSIGLTNTHITSLIVSGTDIYAGTDGGGVFLLAVGESSWAEINTGLIHKNITALAINGSNLFAGTDSNGVFLSNGTSWTNVTNNLNLFDTVIHSLATIGSTIYAGTSLGLYFSSNNGTSWTSAGVPYYITSIASSGTNIFTGGLNGNMYVSIDNGANWANLNTGLSTRDILSVWINGTKIFAGTNGDGAYLSSNNGTGWAAINTGLTNVDVNCFGISGSTIFAGTEKSGFFLTSNAGTSWTAKNNGLTTSAINTLVVDGSNIFAGTAGLGVYLSSDNGDNWTAKNTSLGNLFINAFAISGSNLFAATNSGIYLSTNNGTSWTAKNTGLVFPAIISSIVISGTTIYAGNGGLSNNPQAPQGVSVSTNNGNSWVTKNTGLTNKNIYTLLVIGATIYAGTSDGVFSSPDEITSAWTAMSNGLPDNTNVYSLVSNGGVLIAGTNNGVYYLSEGSLWVAVNGGLPSNNSVNNLILDATHLYAGTREGSVWKRLLTEIAGCVTPDCLVWPGDANKDLTSNNYDLLPIGVHYSQTGFAREDVSNVWTGHNSTDWGSLQANGEDMKHVDCNGDGIINSDDTVAIKSNFAFTHSKTIKLLDANATDPDLYFVSTYTVYAPGSVIDVELWTGNSSQNVSKLYGLAFDINYTTSLVDTGTTLSYSTGFIGSSTISLTNLDEISGTINGAITRIDHTGINGFGKIATMHFKANSNISSLSDLQLSISGYKAIDSTGANIVFNPLTSTIKIDPSLGINNIQEKVFLTVYPNPNSGKFILEASHSASNTEAKIYDVLGNVLDARKINSLKEEIDLSDYSKGIYFLNVYNQNNQLMIEKIIVQ